MVHIQDVLCGTHKARVFFGQEFSQLSHLDRAIQGGLAQGLQSAPGRVMISSTVPTLVILSNPGLFLVSSQLSEVETCIKEMASIVAIWAVGTYLPSGPAGARPGLWSRHSGFTVYEGLLCTLLGT